MLVLDEPGNHLDVETVEALAKALVAYRGTVVFTSHDRHFLKRVATSIIEVRDGRVVNYRGDYEAYLYSVSKEIDDAEHELHPDRAQPAKKAEVKKESKKTPRNEKSERELRKEMAALEKTIARLEDEKTAVNGKLLATTDAGEALRLHTEYETVTDQLTKAEERWFRLQEKFANE